MQPPQQHSRINLAELKAEIVRKLGPEESKQYFYHLNGLLSLKISKVEFNKLCIRILGRDNIPLHNQFIRSILKNACSAKGPPRSHDNDVLKSITTVGSKETPNDGYQQNGSHSAAVQSQQGLSNGDILPLSPRKARTTSRDRRAGDHRSVLGPNGKTKFSSQQLVAKDSSDFNVIVENGLSNPPEVQGSLQHHQGLLQQGENLQEASVHQPVKSAAVNGPQDCPVSVHSKDCIEVSGRGDGKDVPPRSQLQAPLGVPFCPVSVGGAHRALPIASSSKCVSAFNSGVLLDSVTVKERMEQIAAAHGLEGVSVDCANLLSNGLDVYLKGLISSCIALVGPRSGHDPIRNKKQQAPMKLVNGVRPSHLYQMQNSSRPLEVMPEHRPHCPISLQDFRIAMELNPQQLGEDWPLLLEKICTQSFEE